MHSVLRQRRAQDVLAESLASARIVGGSRGGRMHGEAVLASRQTRNGALAAIGQGDGGTLPVLGPRWRIAGDGGGRECGQLGLAFGEAVVGQTQLAVSFDDATALEEVENTHACGVQEICDLGVGERGELVEDEVPVIGFDEDAIEGDEVEVGVQSQIGAYALHGSDRAALAFAHTLEIAHRAAVEPEHAAGEQSRDPAEQLSVVGDASAELEWQGQNPLPQGCTKRQDVIDPVRCGLGHGSAQARRAPRASLARKRDQELRATLRVLALEKSKTVR